jgi:hypothetical protein
VTSTRSGIPTTYRNTTFRSRLEARWAAFFDLVDWSWVYEPFESYQHMPCGHSDDPILADTRRLADQWARAGDIVQWRHRQSA